MSHDRSDEPFLSRWSRQKRKGTEPAPAEAPAAASEPVVDPATLPPIDELTAESDIGPFLRKGVPAALQQLALRKMWSLDPSIRDFVEVAENQWDFNAVGGIPGLFEHIAPDTDMSAWLAQATQSASPAAQVDRAAAAATSRDDAALRHEAVGDGHPARAATFVGDRQAAAAIDDRTDSGQRPEGIDKTGDMIAAADPPASPGRRRHGGALPQ